MREDLDIKRIMKNTMNNFLPINSKTSMDKFLERNQKQSSVKKKKDNLNSYL